MCIRDRCRNGARPVSSRKASAASEYWSARPSSGCAEACSGATNDGVPATTVSRDEASSPLPSPRSPSSTWTSGPAAVEKFFGGLFEAGVSGHKLELIEANGSGDLAVAAAKWSAKGKDGSSLGGVATHEFAKQADGSLKLRLHTFN